MAVKIRQCCDSVNILCTISETANKYNIRHLMEDLSNTKTLVLPFVNIN